MEQGGSKIANIGYKPKVFKYSGSYDPNGEGRFLKISRPRFGSACPWLTLSQSYSQWRFQCECLVIQIIGITTNFSLGGAGGSYSVQFYDMRNYCATSQSECLCICSFLSFYGWEPQVHNSVSNKSYKLLI